MQKSETIADRVLIARKKLSITQRDLADKTGISLSSIQKYESGAVEPSSDAIKRLVMLGISPMWILLGKHPVLLNEDAPISAQVAREESSSLLQRKGELQNSSSTTVDEILEILETHYDDWANRVDANGFAPLMYYRNVSLSAGHGAFNEDEEPEPLMFSRVFLRSIGLPPKKGFVVKVRGNSMEPTIRNGWNALCHGGRKTVRAGLYAVRVDGAEMLKRLESLPGGKIRVSSDNKSYSEYIIDETSTADFEVLGEVVWIGGAP